MGNKSGYISLKIPKALRERFEKVVNGRFGYRSFAEFVIESIRIRLEEFEKLGVSSRG